MKTILLDAIDVIILEDGTVFEEMHQLLEKYPNPKLVLTGANDEQFKEFNLNRSPYEVFTLKHDPEKTDPKYFEILLNKYNLKPSEVVYFEHNKEAAEVATQAGIKTMFYDCSKRDLKELKEFLDTSL
jgi:HAD superfamily hydrolase (TIGR01509 family)